MNYFSLLSSVNPSDLVHSCMKQLIAFYSETLSISACNRIAYLTVWTRLSSPLTKETKAIISPIPSMKYYLFCILCMSIRLFFENWKYFPLSCTFQIFWAAVFALGVGWCRELKKIAKDLNSHKRYIRLWKRVLKRRILTPHRRHCRKWRFRLGVLLAVLLLTKGKRYDKKWGFNIYHITWACKISQSVERETERERATRLVISSFRDVLFSFFFFNYF